LPIKDQKLYALELLRGLCAIGVAAYHFIYWSTKYDLQSVSMFGVYMFFVLSALVLMIRYSRTFEDGIGPDALREFYRNRIARIIPLLLLMAALSFVYFQIRYGNQSLAKAFFTGTGLFFLQLPGALSNTPGAWSLGIELAFYVVFPVVCVLTAKARVTTLALVLAALVFSQQTAIATLHAPDSPDFWGRYSMPLTFAPFFLSGIIIFRARNAEWQHGWVVSIILVGAISLFTPIFPMNLFEGGAAYIALSAIASAAVFFAYSSSLPLAVVPTARLLGNLSYSIYLSHWFVYQNVSWIGPFALRIAAFAGGTFLMSYVIYRFFEIPMKNWLRSTPKRSLAVTA